MEPQESFQLVQTRPSGHSDRRHWLPGPQDLDQAAEWSGPFYFVQAADTQLGLIDRYFKKVEPVTWDEELRLSRLLVDKCNRLQPKPKFVVVCGDLTDADPATMPAMRREQVRDFKRTFAGLDPEVPLVCLCGNHDVGDEPTMELVDGYRRDFGDDYFYFASGGVLFIVINSQFYKHREHVQDYARQQDEWLERVLQKCAQFKHSIVFEHIPWFLKAPDEEDDYFNVDRPVRLHWLEKFHAAGVTKIMCGHYHRNAGGWYKSMELVVTSAVGAAFGEDPCGARLVWVRDERVEHKYFALEALPERVDVGVPTPASPEQIAQP